MRLIDADALISTLENQDYSFAPNTLEGWTPQDMTRAEICDINNAPTVDIVQCKDCKHYRTRWYGFCELIGNENIHREDNDYCSKGERKP